MISGRALPSAQQGAPMASLVFEMAVMLVLILLASELFTNALEHLGAKLRISEGVTGSLFAAVGTALPETMVPLLAIFAGAANAQINEEVGVGAILGAPLMLSTLSTCLMAVAVLGSRSAIGFVNPERSGFFRDLDFFLFAFVVAAAAMFVPEEARYVRAGLSSILVITYLAVVFWQQRDKSKANAGTIEQRRLGILVTRYSKAGKIWSCLLHGAPSKKLHRELHCNAWIGA